MGGVFEHLSSIACVGLPTSNSYARLQPGTWSGCYKAWGVQHKDCPLRFCNWKGKERMEFKCFDGTANPYLFLVCVILSGLDGIRKKSTLPEPVSLADVSKVPGIERLPEDLSSALAALASDDILMSLGEVLKNFICIKKAEMEVEPKDLLQVLLERF